MEDDAVDHYLNLGTVDTGVCSEPHRAPQAPSRSALFLRRRRGPRHRAAFEIAFL